MSEILAPCGTFEALTAAVNTGADAVYLGCVDFNARKNAENFTSDRLKEAIELCHRNSVKVYITLNTLIYDREAESFIRTVTECAENGADALIVQDLGAAALIRKTVSDIPLHASTQMTVNSPAGAMLAKELGFSRVVLGRELSFEQIRDIVSSCDIETEVFVHGALCVSVSGQCGMSAALGGRSANRGMCAQPCRLGFSCLGRENVLSLKDLSLIERLKELEEIGVTSFKIEGRMKRPEYVAAAVAACRDSVGGKPPNMQLLRGVFSRSGFTDGYFTGNFHNMQGIRTKEDVFASAGALQKAEALYAKPFKRYKCDISATVTENKPISVTVSAKGHSVTVSGSAPQKALKHELTSDAVCAQLEKLGGTEFYCENTVARVEPGLSVSLSELNDFRRRAVRQLSDKILAENTPVYVFKSPMSDGKAGRAAVTPLFADKKSVLAEKSERFGYRCEVYTARQLDKAIQIKEFSFIYCPDTLLSSDTADKERIVAVPPVFLGDCEKETAERLAKLKEYGFSNVAVHTLSHINIARRLGMTPFGTYRLNITNSFTLNALSALGVKDAVLSPELTLRAAKSICADPDVKRGIIAYGRLPLMLTRRCPINDGMPCGRVKRKNCPHALNDRKGRSLICLCSDNAVEILNPDVLYLGDKQDELRGFDFVILRFTDETDPYRQFSSFVRAERFTENFTRGSYFKGTTE